MSLTDRVTSKLTVTCIVSLLAITLSVPAVSASQLNDDIGIVLGQTCLTMIKNNVTSDCPTYDEIMVIHPDTSDQKISGGFSFFDGMLQREKGMKNHDKFYDYDEPQRRLWIDPPGNIRSDIAMIIVEPSVPQYKIRGQI